MAGRNSFEYVFRGTADYKGGDVLKSYHSEFTQSTRGFFYFYSKRIKE